MEYQETNLKDQLSRLEILCNAWLSHIDNPSKNSINTSGNAVVYIQAGGIFALVLFFIASMTLGIALATSFEVSSRMTKIETKQDEQGQYLTAIYMMAPQLQPKDKIHEQSKSQ